MEAMTLPTYEAAMMGCNNNDDPGSTERTPITPPRWSCSLTARLLGRYFDGNMLATLCCVSKNFCVVFREVLWSNPFVIIGGMQSPIYRSYQFLYLSSYASYDIRCLVQTLDFQQINYFDLGQNSSTSLSSTEREIRDSAYSSAWFLHCTRNFPEVRFIMMDGLPPAIYEQPGPLNIEEPDPLNLFRNSYHAVEGETASCKPAKGRKPKPMLFTYNGDGRLSLFRFIIPTALMYLDLSGTRPDATPHWFLAIFSRLRILKLRGCGLRLEDTVRLIREAPSLWALDVRDNDLDDRFVDFLLNNVQLAKLPAPFDTTPRMFDQHMYADAPVYTRHEAILSSVVSLRPTEKRSFVKYLLENDCLEQDGNLMSVRASNPLLRETGITQLLISGNQLSPLGIKRLLQDTNRFQELDIGTVENEQHFAAWQDTTGHKSYGDPDLTTMACLTRYSGTQLEILRVHHSVVTFTATLTDKRTRSNAFTLSSLKLAEQNAEMHATFTRMRSSSTGSKALTPFSPQQNYRIHELTLTSLPSKSYGFTIARLIDCLEDCAVQEAHLRKARANMRNGRRAPPLLPGLRVLRLEFIPEDVTVYAGRLSVSEDPDADIYHVASASDFSFFDGPAPLTAQSSTAESSREFVLEDWKGKERTEQGEQAEQSDVDWETCVKSLEEITALDYPPEYDGVRDVRKALMDWRAANEGRWTGRIMIVQTPLEKMG